MMDLIQKCTCLKPGLSFEKVPCPPPLFYDQFGEYALTKNLSRTEVCEIAETCMNRFQTTNSSQIIKNICNPQMTTIPVTTTTTVPPTTPTTTSPQTKNTNITQTATSPFSITSTTHQKVTSFHVPIVIASSCNGICVFGIVFGILLLIAAVIAVVLIRKFKCPCVISSSRMRPRLRKKNDRHSLVDGTSNSIRQNISVISLASKDENICMFAQGVITQGFQDGEKKETAYENMKVIIAQVETVKSSRTYEGTPGEERDKQISIDIDMTEEKSSNIKAIRTKFDEEEGSAVKASVTIKMKSLDESFGHEIDGFGSSEETIDASDRGKRIVDEIEDKRIGVADTNGEKLMELKNIENVRIEMTSSDDDSNEDDENDISDGNGNADNCDDDDDGDDDDDNEEDSGDYHDALVTI